LQIKEKIEGEEGRSRREKEKSREERGEGKRYERTKKH
jgi:hypothetical protein